MTKTPITYNQAFALYVEETALAFQNGTIDINELNRRMTKTVVHATLSVAILAGLVLPQTTATK